MTVEEHIHRMEELFGVLPNPEHYPIRFKYFVDLYEFYIKQGYYDINMRVDTNEDIHLENDREIKKEI